MRLKDENGGMVDVGRQGQTTLNTVLGAIGTAGSLGIMSGLFGNGNRNQPQTDGDKPVTRFEMGLMMEGMKKDVELAEMKAKMAAMEQMNAMEKKQMEFNAEQMAYNATMNAMAKGVQAQIDQMQSMMKVVIPSSNVVDIPAAAQPTGGGN